MRCVDATQHDDCCPQDEVGPSHFVLCTHCVCNAATCSLSGSKRRVVSSERKNFDAFRVPTKQRAVWTSLGSKSRQHLSGYVYSEVSVERIFLKLLNLLLLCCMLLKNSLNSPIHWHLALFRVTFLSLPTFYTDLTQGVRKKRYHKVVRIHCFHFGQITVDEIWISRAMINLLEREKLVVEGAAACSVAALMAGKVPELRGKK